MVTELDIKLSGTDSADERYQAAIWGDYLDACLYASNCFEFINWECVLDSPPSCTSAAADTALLPARVTTSRGSAPRVLALSSTRTATRSRPRMRLQRVSSATRAARASSARLRSARARAPSPRASARPLLLPLALSPLRPLPRRRPAPPAAALWRSTASVVARVRFPPFDTIPYPCTDSIWVLQAGPAARPAHRARHAPWATHTTPSAPLERGAGCTISLCVPFGNTIFRGLAVHIRAPSTLTTLLALRSVQDQICGTPSIWTCFVLIELGQSGCSSSCMHQGRMNNGYILQRVFTCHKLPISHNNRTL
jgi:hypothetical protein